MEEKIVTMEQYTYKFLEEIYKTIGKGWKFWVLSKTENEMLNEILLYSSIWLESYFLITSYPLCYEDKLYEILLDSFINYNKKIGVKDEKLADNSDNLSTTFHFISDYFDAKYNGKIIIADSYEERYDEMGLCIYMSAICQAETCIPKIVNNKVLHSMIAEYYVGIIKDIIKSI